MEQMERTLLHNAVVDRHVERVKIQLKEKTDVNGLDTERVTPLHLAALICHAEIVKLLLKHGANVNVSNIHGSTPLHFAVVDCAVPEVVQLLLKHGASVNVLDSWGKSPLYYAVSNHDVDSVKLILEHGADVNLLYANGNTVLHKAVSQHTFDVFESLKHHRGSSYVAVNLRKEARYPVVQKDRGVIVELLLRHGASVNTLNHLRKSPLHYAVQEPHAIIVEHGADVNVLDYANRTPLHNSVVANYPDISVLKTLIKYGANVDAVSLQDESVLYVAVSNPTTPYAMVKLLLENGATPDFDGKINILVNIVQRDHYRIAELLIQYIIIRLAANSGHFQVLGQFKSILLTQIAKRSDSYKYIFKAACLCSIEVAKMKDECIYNEQTLFEFVSQNCSQSTPHDQSVALNSIDALLLLLNNGRYVACRELIYAAIKRSVLIDRLCELFVCYQVHCFNPYQTLNYDCINSLAKYLSKDDIINMIVFSGKYEYPNTRTSKRSAEDGDENMNKKLRK